MRRFGIIGSSREALLLCQELQKRGIWVNHLTRHQNSTAHHLADSRYNARDISAIINFAAASDKVFIIDRELQTSVLKELSHLTSFVQNLDLYHLIGQKELLKDYLAKFSDLITKDNKIQMTLNLACLGTKIGCDILAISQSLYDKGQLKETIVSPKLDETLETSLFKKAIALTKAFSLDEIFYLKCLVFEDGKILIEDVKQNRVPDFDPTEIAWKQGLFELLIKKALDYPMVLHLGKEPTYYTTWLTVVEYEKLLRQIPYFPDFNIGFSIHDQSPYLVLSEPNLNQKLQTFKKIMG